MIIFIYVVISIEKEHYISKVQCILNTLGELQFFVKSKCTQVAQLFQSDHKELLPFSCFLFRHVDFMLLLIFYSVHYSLLYSCPPVYTKWHKNYSRSPFDISYYLPCDNGPGEEDLVTSTLLLVLFISFDCLFIW